MFCASTRRLSLIISKFFVNRNGKRKRKKPTLPSAANKHLKPLKPLGCSASINDRKLVAAAAVAENDADSALLY